MTLTSRADVATDAPARYAKQLVSHLGRRLEGSVDEDSGVGRLTGPAFAVTLEPAGSALVLEASAEDAEGLDRITDVVGSHLQRFAASTEELTVAWVPVP
jgi:hypothetical protein